jgi:hypothetical protein
MRYQLVDTTTGEILKQMRALPHLSSSQPRRRNIRVIRRTEADIRLAAVLGSAVTVFLILAR